jgi:hypothetical protein
MTGLFLWIAFPDDEGTRDAEFWKMPARRICSVLSSDMDAMRKYLDAIQETMHACYQKEACLISAT